MSSNLYRLHVVILPEDSANIDLVNGFMLALNNRTRQMQVLHAAGGWRNVVARFLQNEVPRMRQYVERRVILLIDLDNEGFDRKYFVENQIPTDLRARVFLLGVASEPEALGRSCGKHLEEIGMTLAKECEENREELWQHVELVHNRSELAKLRIALGSVLASDFAGY